MLEREVSEVTGFPSGLAVTPDGRWLVSLGFSRHNVSLYDAATLDRLVGPLNSVRSSSGESIQFVHPHAVVVSPDGSLAVLTNRSGVIGLSLPSLGFVFHSTHSARGFPRQIVRDRAGENYYVGGEYLDVARLTADGDVQALFESEGIEGMALTRDEEELLVLTDFGRRLVILSASVLAPRLSVDIPFEGEVVVPLRGQDRAIVVGGAPRDGDTAAKTPLMALSVDTATGSVGSVQVLCCENPGGLTFLVGDGNQWTDVGEATAIVPTAVGTVTIDTNLGIVSRYSAAALQNDQPPCCDIARYPNGNRVVMANSKFIGGGGFPGGSLIVYEVTE